MDEEDAEQLAEAVKDEDMKRVLVKVLSRQTQTAALAPPDMRADVAKRQVEAVADSSVEHSKPQYWIKCRGVDGYKPASIPCWTHILGSGLTSVLGLGAYQPGNITTGSTNTAAPGIWLSCSQGFCRWYTTS